MNLISQFIEKSSNVSKYDREPVIVNDVEKSFDDTDITKQAVYLDDNLKALESTLAIEASIHGAMTPNAARMLQIAQESINRSLGITTSDNGIPSFEHFNNSRTSGPCTILAMESISSTMKKIWESIKKFFKNIWKAIKGFFMNLFIEKERSKKDYEEIKKLLDDLPSLPSTTSTSFENERLFEMFSIEGEISRDTIVKLLENHHKAVIASKEGLAGFNIELAGVLKSYNKLLKEVNETDFKDKLTSPPSFDFNEIESTKINVTKTLPLMTGSTTYEGPAEVNDKEKSELGYESAASLLRGNRFINNKAIYVIKESSGENYIKVLEYNPGETYTSSLIPVFTRAVMYEFYNLSKKVFDEVYKFDYEKNAKKSEDLIDDAFNAVEKISEKLNQAMIKVNVENNDTLINDGYTDSLEKLKTNIIFFRSLQKTTISLFFDIARLHYDSCDYTNLLIKEVSENYT